MAEINILFKKLLLKRDLLSNLESQVLEYILEYPEKVTEKNIEDFAAELYVSTATVSRTCKKLGFKGYQQLKYTLEQYTEIEANKKIHKVDKTTSIENHEHRFNRELKETLKEINSYNITKAASLIKSSNHIELFGVGASLPSSIDIARKLTFTGKLASARSDWDELRVVANHLNKDDLAILISHSGETLHLIEYATILKRSEVPFILLVGTSDSYIESLATLTLYGYSESVYYGDIDMSSRFTIYLLMDLVLFNYLDSFKD